MILAMALISSQRRRPSSPQTTKVQRLPAANRGMDGRTSIGQGTPDVAVYTYNLMAGEYAMKVRSGYQEQAIDLLSVESTGVKTIIPFDAIDGADNKLFASTNEGIWDVTEYDNPVLVQPYTIFDGSSGIAVYTHYINDAGENLLVLADGENGLFFYTQSTGLWAPMTGNITGVDPTKVRFVAVHKQRIWLIEQDSTDAWYLPISSVSGQAIKFQFGAQFKHGGKLVGLYNWTVDGGEGVDDYLVAISNSGDVLPYQGADPESSTDPWNIRGVYYVGAVAGSKRCASEFGGDLHILSTYGLTAMSDLLRGVMANDTSRKESIGSRMAYLLQQDMKEYRIDDGWGIDFAPSQGSFIISSPIRADDIYLQYVYDVSNDSFGWWRDVPMLSFAEWQGVLYIGTQDSRVLAMNTDLDEVKITAESEQNGKEINFSTLFAFLPYDASGAFKRGVNIRPDFMSSRKTNFEAKFAYDYNILRFSNTLSGVTNPAGRWDVGLWDSAIWGSSQLINRATVLGGSGIGRTMAVAVNGSGTSDTWLMSYDVMWNSGGML